MHAEKASKLVMIAPANNLRVKFTVKDRERAIALSFWFKRPPSELNDYSNKKVAQLTLEWCELQIDRCDWSNNFFL